MRQLTKAIQPLACVAFLGGIAVLAGCPRSAPPGKEGGETKTTRSETLAPEASAAQGGLVSENRILEHVRISETGPAWSVTRIQGCPLVLTRQVFGPVDGDDRSQIAGAWQQLTGILTKAHCNADRIVRLNVAASNEETLAATFQFLEKVFRPGLEPAVTYVVTPLPAKGVKIGLDAVAVPGGDVNAVNRWQSENPDGLNRVDAIVAPAGGLVFFSGQPDKSPLPQAAANALRGLLETAQALQISEGDILQLRVFVQPASKAAQVFQEIEKAFSGKSIPPVVYTEWVASAPVEIEMVARLPEKAVEGTAPLRFYNPPGVKPSPTFTRVVFVQTDRLIFLPGLVSQETGAADVQAADVFKQLGDILTAQGSDWQHLVKATYFVTDKDASAAIDAIRPKFFASDRPPAASKVTVHSVGWKDRSLSVDVIAVPVHP
ncbi:Rid family hydrolase [Thermogutta sp.]|uniref:Rid family hydrolase n=1 Tax=Thermogutta sp. TaxID=1962930 RepID=UPI0032208163